jgi:hypothetical protein
MVGSHGGLGVQAVLSEPEPADASPATGMKPPARPGLVDTGRMVRVLTVGSSNSSNAAALLGRRDHSYGWGEHEEESRVPRQALVRIHGTGFSPPPVSAKKEEDRAMPDGRPGIPAESDGES